MNKILQAKNYLYGSFLLMAATAAHAVPVELDVTDVVAQIGKGITAVSAIAVAILSIYGVAKCYNLVKKAF